MGSIVAVSRDLTRDMIAHVTRGSWHSLTLGPVGTVGQDLGDDLEPARVAEPAKDERNVSSYVPVRMSQPVHQRGEDDRVVIFHDGFCDLELPPQNLLRFEPLDQRSNSHSS